MNSQNPFAGPVASCLDLMDLILEKGFFAAAIEHEALHAAMRQTTTATFVFNVFVIGSAFIVGWFLQRTMKKFWTHAAIMALGVLVFEMFTAPMWSNNNLGRWAYVYQDVSWILTLGWTTLFMGVIGIIDHRFAGWTEKRRFGLYLVLLMVLVLIAESVVVAIGIREYSPEVLEAVSGVKIFELPIEILFYVPVFSSLIIAFYKYWSFYLDDSLVLTPIKKRNWFRGLGLGFVSVFFFELVVEPMVKNQNLPSWSYVYNDISFLLTGAWVLMIGLAAVLVDKFLWGVPLPLKFLSALLIIGAFALPFESWLIHNDFRVYGDTALSNFTGFQTPITGVATEVAFAIPCYLALVVGFIRYWEIVLDNQL